MLTKNQVRLIVVGAVLLLGTVFTVAMFDITPIHGNEVGVKETWFHGVEKDPLLPYTYFVLPWERVTPYTTSVRVFVMNDKSTNRGTDAQVDVGRENDVYAVSSKDNQEMKMSLQVLWRLDPTKVVDLHKTVGHDNIADKILRPILLRVVKDNATTREAINAYSGEGLVKLQQDIEKSLNDETGELRQHGVIIDNFVIEHLGLDPDFLREITLRQVATQKKLRADAEEKAAQADALKAKAVARADYEKQVVEAERDKAVKVLAAEATNEQSILAAEAEAKKVTLAAEADAKKVALSAEAEAKKVVISAQAKKDAGELEAAGILAVGKATAEAEKLKFSAYGATGAEVYARIEVAKSLAMAFGNIKGYLPENMQIITLGDNFLKSVENVVSAGTKSASKDTK
jgi:regulator of protease activity HflC (stomatin/prohibitin superfamily)